MGTDEQPTMKVALAAGIVAERMGVSIPAAMHGLRERVASGGGSLEAVAAAAITEHEREVA
jgi:hypothetical protein